MLSDRPVPAPTDPIDPAAPTDPTDEHAPIAAASTTAPAPAPASAARAGRAAATATAPTGPPLVLHARRDVNALSAVGCAVATLASLWMYRQGTANPLWNAALLLFVPTFGIATAALVRRVLDPRPALVVDERGIRDRRSGVDVAWRDVRRIHVWRQQMKTTRVDWIALDVVDPEKARPGVLNRSPALKAVARAMGAPPVLLQTSDLAMPHDALLAELQRRHAAHSGG